VIAPALAVSVIVCAYTQRRWEELQAAVESVRRQPETAQVVVVIDHEDELLRLARRRWPTLVVLPNAGDQGLSGARNTGIAAATNDLVAFLDDDAIADEEWLSRMLGAFADADVVGVGGRALPVWPDAAGPALYPDELLWIVGCSYRGLPERPGEVRNVIGCSMVFRRAAVLAAGGFSTGIGRVGAHPLGCEETELCIRIRQQNPAARIRYEPTSTVRHRVSADRGTWTYLRRRSFYEGVSKAVLSRRLGAGDSLSSESAYLTRVLPGAVLRGLLTTGRGGFTHAAAIMTSVGMTVAGYAVGSLSRSRVTVTPHPPASAVVELAGVVEREAAIEQEIASEGIVR
jgi:glucosyl-dolichyl phosphate glucuronosyltransferase